MNILLHWIRFEISCWDHFYWAHRATEQWARFSQTSIQLDSSWQPKKKICWSSGQQYFQSSHSNNNDYIMEGGWRLVWSFSASVKLFNLKKTTSEHHHLHVISWQSVIICITKTMAVTSCSGQLQDHLAGLWKGDNDKQGAGLEMTSKSTWKNMFALNGWQSTVSEYFLSHQQKQCSCICPLWLYYVQGARLLVVS